MTKNRWLSDLHWRRDSQQSRSEKTQNAILDAAKALIVEKGMEGTSISDIAKRSESSVGAVYHHFKDKRAIFYALFDRMTQAFQDLSAQVSDPKRWEGASVRDLLEGYIDFMQELRVLAGPAKTALNIGLADDPELKAHMAEIGREGRKALLALVLDRKDEIKDPSREFAASFVIDQISAMLGARTDAYQTASALQSLDDAQFKAEVLRLACLRLGLD